MVVEKVGLATSAALEFSSTTMNTCFTGDFGAAAARAGPPEKPIAASVAAARALAHHRRHPVRWRSFDMGPDRIGSGTDGRPGRAVGSAVRRLGGRARGRGARSG